MGQGHARTARQAQQIHFALYETQEKNLNRFGPQAVKPIVTLEGGKPNQVAPVAAVVDPRVMYLDDNGKAPSAMLHRDPRHGGKDQR
jgi:hypothetical protein